MTRFRLFASRPRESDPRLPCTGTARSDCFFRPAMFKRLYLIELSQAYGDVVKKNRLRRFDEHY